MSDPHLPTASDYLPDWTARRLVVLEQSPKWATAIEAELRFLLPTDQSATLVESCGSYRETIDLLQLRNSVGLVLFLAGMEKECCHLLARLPTLSARHPVLIVAEEVHRSILPVLLEAGPTAFLMNVQTDRPIAAWCERVLQANLMNR